eukprot:4668899-Pleurochrysis_carterae.AAC.2
MSVHIAEHMGTDDATARVAGCSGVSMGGTIRQQSSQRIVEAFNTCLRDKRQRCVLNLICEGAIQSTEKQRQYRVRRGVDLAPNGADVPISSLSHHETRGGATCVCAVCAVRSLAGSASSARGRCAPRPPPAYPPTYLTAYPSTCLLTDLPTHLPN